MQSTDLHQILSRTALSDAGCMEWQRARSKAGYGQLWDGTRVMYVHRLVATLVYGPPNPDDQVLHACDNPPCVNPKHLSWGTRAQNMADAKAKGRLKGKRHAFGEASVSPLKIPDIRAIRARREAGEIYRTIADDFGVTIAAIARICQRQTWKEVE